MRLDELAVECVAALGRGSEALTLKIPRGWKPPKGFPRRELMCETSHGGPVWRIDARRLLAWLIGCGIVKVQAKETPHA